MRRVTLMATIILSLLPLAPAAASSTQPDLVISQFKVTTQDGQFFMLHNAGSEVIDMGSAQLVYYNNYDLSAATSSKIIGLSGHLKPGEYYLINDGPYTLCYQMLVNSTNLSFSTTGGTLIVQTLEQDGQGKPITSRQHDWVSWSRHDRENVQRLPENNQSLLRRPVDTQQHPLISAPGVGSWLAVSQSTDNPCVLESHVIYDAPEIIQTSMLLLSSTPPPVTIVSRMQTVATTSGPYMPAGNIGLMAPVVNELLANPGSPQLDADDEFIELYNPNDKPFELTGFKLQVGLNTKRKYKFPAGTILKPKSFTAFYSEQTNLALSNSGSVAELADPFDNVISTADAYGKMKEDIAWALANNEWLATTSPTPGEQNLITGGTTGSEVSVAGATQGRSTKARSTKSTNATAGFQDDTQQKVADVHPGTLAGMAGMALGYGAYEYRTDAANKYRQYRANRTARRKAGS